MDIHVTAEDIAYAERQNRWGCAIVRSIQRENPEALFVRVDKEIIAFSEGGHRYTYPTPQAAVERIIKPFDEGKHVQPTTIRISVTPTVREVSRITPEKKQQLRQIDRHRQTGKIQRSNREHNRFCEVPDASASA